MQFICMLIFHTVFASFLKYGVTCLFGATARATLSLTSHASKVSTENNNLILSVPLVAHGDSHLFFFNMCMVTSPILSIQ